MSLYILLPLQGVFSAHIYAQGDALGYVLLAFLALQLVLSLEKSRPLACLRNMNYSILGIHVV